MAARWPLCTESRIRLAVADVGSDFEFEADLHNLRARDLEVGARSLGIVSMNAKSSFVGLVYTGPFRSYGQLLILNAGGTARTVLSLNPVRGGGDAQNFLDFPRCTGRRCGNTVADAAPHAPDGFRRRCGGIGHLREA